MAESKQKNHLFSIDKSRYNRIPCGKGNKQHLVPTLETTELQRKYKRECLAQERQIDKLNHKEYFEKEARRCQFGLQELEERIKDGQQRLEPRLETDLIDLNDFPSKRKIRQLEENIKQTHCDRIRWQNKKQFYEKKIENLKEEMKKLKPTDWNISAENMERKKYLAHQDYERVIHEEKLLESSIKEQTKKKRILKEKTNEKNQLLKQLMSTEADKHNKLTSLMDENNCLKRIRMEKLKAIIEIHKKFDHKELEIAGEVLDMKEKLDGIDKESMMCFIQMLKQKEKLMIQEMKMEEEEENKIMEIESKKREEIKRFNEYMKKENKREELEYYFGDNKENRSRGETKEQKHGDKVEVLDAVTDENNEKQTEHKLSTLKIKEKHENLSKIKATSEATTEKPCVKINSVHRTENGKDLVKKWTNNKSTIALACKLKDCVTYEEHKSKLSIPNLEEHGNKLTLRNLNTSDTKLKKKRQVVVCDDEPKQLDKTHENEQQDKYNMDKVYKHPYSVYKDILELQDEKYKLTNILKQQEAIKPLKGIKQEKTLDVRIENIEKKLSDKGVHLNRKLKKKLPLLKEGTRILKIALDDFVKIRKERGENFNIASNTIARLQICIVSEQNTWDMMKEIEDRNKVLGKDISNVNDPTVVPIVLKNIDQMLLPYLMQIQKDHPDEVTKMRRDNDLKKKGMGCPCVK